MGQVFVRASRRARAYTRGNPIGRLIETRRKISQRLVRGGSKISGPRRYQLSMSFDRVDQRIKKATDYYKKLPKWIT